MVAKPEVCSSCHAQLTVAETLMESSHAKFSCTTCHKSSGILNVFKSQEVVASSNNIDTITPIDNKVCEQCHSMENRKVSPSTTIKIPHGKILAKGVKCVECHVGVVHGKRDERGSGVVTFTGPRMPTCIQCHIERDLPTNCSFCHTDEKKPKSHDDDAWVNEGKHGEMAKKDVGVCQMCHAFTKDRAVNMGVEGMEAAEFARSNKFCSNCHMSNRPESHTEIWPIVHKAQAIPNMGKCLTCHDREQPDPNDRAVQRIYCNKCHAADKHPSDWRSVHPSVVKSIGIVEGKCFNCHASTHCAKCHKANNVRQLKPEDLQTE
jgi:nitrate/TMAO reductase-like tetraheme cytochrome c subunit